MRPFPTAVFLALVLAAWVAPPMRPDWQSWCGDLLAGRWEGTEPLTVALFQAMGLWPWLMASLLADELRGAAQPARWTDRVPAWPFLVLSNVGGMFLLGVYAILRSEPRPPQPPTRWLAWAAHPLLPAAVGVVAVLLVGFGATAGSVTAFLEDAISAARPAPRASRRLAMFAQAINSTTPVTPNSSMSGVRASLSIEL